MWTEAAQSKCANCECAVDSIRALKEKLQNTSPQYLKGKYVVELCGVILVGLGNGNPKKMIQKFCGIDSAFAHDCELADWSGSLPGVIVSGDNLLSMCLVKTAGDIKHAVYLGHYGSLTHRVRCNLRLSVSSERCNLWDNDFGISLCFLLCLLYIALIEYMRVAC